MRLNVLNTQVEILVDVTQEDIDKAHQIRKQEKTLHPKSPVSLAFERETNLITDLGEILITFFSIRGKQLFIGLLPNDLIALDLKFRKSDIDGILPKPISSYCTLQGNYSNILEIIRVNNLQSFNTVIKQNEINNGYQPIKLSEMKQKQHLEKDCAEFGSDST